MADSITIVDKEECCGCKACADVCSVKAISFAKDNEGFAYPQVQESCVKCGLCTKICPVLNSHDRESVVNQDYLACLDKNQTRRDTGSSGGIFGLLASKLLAEGWIVCGAAFDNHLQLKHTFASTDGEIPPLKKSKYLQSNTEGVYSAIKAKLDAGGRVMFVGTPCQCNGLKNYLRKDYNGQLIVVDFACHGVPSQDLFDKCIEFYEQKNQCRVLSYQFRHKPKRYASPQNFLLSIQNGDVIKSVEGKYYEEPFYFGFQKYMTLRPSCYRCHWATTDRVSDITMADFWGIEKVTSQWDRRDHPSLVILNTDFGKSCFQKIDKDIYSLEVTREDAVRGNGSLIGPTKCPAERVLFFNDLQSESFERVVKKHLTPKRRFLKDIYYAIPFVIRRIALNKLGKL